MPICVTCNVEFNNWQKVDDKLRNISNRKKCLDCSPFGSKAEKNSISLNCAWCNKEILVRKKESSRKFCSHECSSAARRSRIEAICGNCSALFFIKPSRVSGTIYGINFCSKKCRYEAQRVTSGVATYKVKHYKDGSSYYRNMYKREHGKLECVVCGYKKEECMIDVDHKDGNRKNNNIDNLQGLCVWCHALKTRMGLSFNG
jgi:hypothetical protein